MIFKKNFNSTYILYLVIFVLSVLLLIVSTLFYYAYNNIKKQNIIVVDKNVKIDSCPSCPSCPSFPKVDSSIPIYPKELPFYNNHEYQQVGILTSNDDNEPIILPLLSKRANNHRDRWNYYTTTDKNTMLRLPISYNNMKCDDDIGCNEIYDGNTLNIEMYKGKTFTATIYKKQTPLYFADKY
jgi:Family of unknown function (DUF5755)